MTVTDANHRKLRMWTRSFAPATLKAFRCLVVAQTKKQAVELLLKNNIVINRALFDAHWVESTDAVDAEQARTHGAGVYTIGYEPAPTQEEPCESTRTTPN